MPDSVTQILRSGPPGAKKNIAVLGDGFAAADQTAYNDVVDALLIDGVFGNDYFYEDAQAFNIFRVNLISSQSGVSQRVYDEKGGVLSGLFRTRMPVSLPEMATFCTLTVEAADGP